MKYALTKNTKTYSTKKLHQIVALESFGKVNKGDLGGWIESEANLSQDGLCWIEQNVLVFGDGRVLDNAYISGDVIVNGIVKNYVSIESINTHIRSGAIIEDDVMLRNSSGFISGKVSGAVLVEGYCNIDSWAEITDSVYLINSNIFGGKISGETILDSCTVYGDSVIGKNAYVNKCITFHSAKLENPDDVLIFENIIDNCIIYCYPTVKDKLVIASSSSNLLKEHFELETFKQVLNEEFSEEHKKMFEMIIKIIEMKKGL